MSRRSTYFALLALIAATLAPGRGTATAACTRISGVSAHLPDGLTQGVTLVLEGDRIVEVVRSGGASQRQDCTEVDGKRLTATPGLVETFTRLGIVEVALEALQFDADAASGPGARSIRARFEVRDAYNPRSTLIPVARLGGITSAVVVPSGGLVAGQAAWVDLAGATQADAVVQPSAAVLVTLGPRDRGSRGRALQDLRDLLEEAKLFAKNRKEWEKNRTRPFASPRDLEAMQAVLERRTPLVAAVDRASDIEALLRLTDDYSLRTVIAGGAEAHALAQELGKRRIPVIVNPLVHGPGSIDQIRARPDNARLLARAGVPVMLSTFASYNVRTLAQVAGNAVRGGLDHAAAIKALTQTPAEVFGLKGYGRLEAGAIANLVLWTGDPLELSSAVEHLFIRGRRIPLVSRQTLLRDRYRKLPIDSQRPLRLP